MHTHPLRFYPATILLCSMVGSVFSPVLGRMAALPYKQDVFLTAYYSPEPDQCCYIQGTYEDEVIMNGQGIHGADGTPVYPGMLAAPKEISFGTVIQLPGIGIGTVHDRGGWITMMEEEGKESVAHIDIWVGSGEEGLARALSFGTQRVTATIYPVGSDAPEETLILANLPAPRSALAAAIPSANRPSLLLAESKEGDQSSAVLFLQASLNRLGYLDGLQTGLFEERTKAALARFQVDHHIKGDGSIADDRTRARLLAAEKLMTRAPADCGELAMGDTGQQVNRAQGVLRYLGAYSGRTTGTFDERLRDAVVAFQVEARVIDSPASQGAGRIGPKTKSAIIHAWRIKRAKSEASAIFLTMQVTKIVLQKHLPSSVLARGSSGDDVKRLQRLLVRKGFLSKTDINGTFGEKTEKAVEAMQLKEKIIVAKNDHGAGVVGPMTRKILEEFAVADGIRIVRSNGFQYL